MKDWWIVSKNKRAVQDRGETENLFIKGNENFFDEMIYFKIKKFPRNLSLFLPLKIISLSKLQTLHKINIHTVQHF